MPTYAPVIVDAALEAVKLIVKAGADVAELHQEFDHARIALQNALEQVDTRVALLDRLAQAHRSGQIPDAAYHQVLVTIGRMLKSSAGLTTELARLTDSRGN